MKSNDVLVRRCNGVFPWDGCQSPSKYQHYKRNDYVPAPYKTKYFKVLTICCRSSWNMVGLVRSSGNLLYFPLMDSIAGLSAIMWWTCKMYEEQIFMDNHFRRNVSTLDNLKTLTSRFGPGNFKFKVSCKVYLSLIDPGKPLGEFEPLPHQWLPPLWKKNLLGKVMHKSILSMECSYDYWQQCYGIPDEKIAKK